MELLKESSKHGIITIQNRVGHVRDLKNHGFSNNLSSEIHKKASAQHTNVVQNVPIYFCQKKFRLFVLI